MTTYEVDNTWKPSPATCVVVTGPHSNADAQSDWEEYPEWAVGMMNDDGDEVGKVYFLRNFKAAEELGKKMAHDRKLEYINEATPWFN